MRTPVHVETHITRRRHRRDHTVRNRLTRREVQIAAHSDRVTTRIHRHDTRHQPPDSHPQQPSRSTPTHQYPEPGNPPLPNTFNTTGPADPSNEPALPPPRVSNNRAGANGDDPTPRREVAGHVDQQMRTPVHVETHITRRRHRRDHTVRNRLTSREVQIRCIRTASHTDTPSRYPPPATGFSPSATVTFNANAPIPRTRQPTLAQHVQHHRPRRPIERTQPCHRPRVSNNRAGANGEIPLPVGK